MKNNLARNFLLLLIAGLFVAIFVNKQVDEHGWKLSRPTADSNKDYEVRSSNSYPNSQQFNLGLVEAALSKYHKVSFLPIVKGVDIDVAHVPDWIREFIISGASNVGAKQVVYNKNKFGYIVEYELNGGKETYATLGKSFTQSVSSRNYLAGQWAEVYGFVDFEQGKARGRIEWRLVKPDLYTITVQTSD